MSKFLPMFKKKGKGKEEDVIEETKKKRSKAHKLTKEILSSPSSSVVTKGEKKRKTTKRKAPIPQGKENFPSVEELEKEFFVDDSGVVRECPSELYIDSTGAVREGPRELFIDNALALDSNPETVSDTSHEDCSLAKEKQENGSPHSSENKEIQESSAKNNVVGSDSNHDSSFEEPLTKEHDPSSENQKNNEVDHCGGDREQCVSPEKNGDECVVLRSKKTTENDTPLSAKLASRLSVSEEMHYWQEEEAVILDCDPVADSTEDIKQEPEEVDEKASENIHEDAEVDETVNVPLVSAPDIGDDHVTVRMDGNSEAETEMGEERSSSGAQEESLVDTFYTNTPDSDDDFDSAKEDWDDEDSEDKEPEENQVNLLEKEDFEQSSGREEIAEAENVEMRDSYQEGCSRHASTTSSIYQDAPSRENSLFDINSIIEATNEGHGSLEGNLVESSQQKKLTRKVSNVSVCSSDIFNEELDDLLNEELDRLSEEESSTTNLQDSVVEADKVPSQEATEDSTPEPQHQVVTEQSLSEAPHAEHSETTPPEEAESVVEVITTGENVSEGPNKEPTGNVITNRPEENESDGHATPQEDKSCEHNVAEESVTSPTTQAPEEGLEQAKDSGYYSLPVSPKANTVAVSEREEAASTDPSVPHHSQQDSKEEDLPVSAAEMTISTSVLEAHEVQSPLVKDSVPDQPDASVSPKPSQSCAAPEGSEEASSPTRVKSTPLVEEKIQENSELPQKVDEKQRPTFEKFKSPPPDLKGTAASPGIGGSVPGRHSRHKSPGWGCEGGRHSEEKMLSPDPVGDLFLQQAVCLSHEEAEARLAQRRAARAEARELRLRELEKQQHEQENDEEKQFASPSYSEPTPRAGLGRTGVRSSGMNCSDHYSRRSSEDSTTDEATLPANVREMRSELKELDEKFRKAMITNAQLDNEKATLTFEVELMKDRYTELEEAHTQLTKEHRKKCTEYEQLRKVSTKLQEEVKILRSMLQERDQLIQEYGLVVMGEEENGEDIDHTEEEDVDDLSPRKLAVKKVLVSQEAAELLSKGAAQGSLDVRLKKFGEEKNDLEDQVRRLKLELEEERNKNRRRENGLDYEKQKEQSKTVNEYKFRVQKAEAEVSTLQANATRLDALLTRYKTQSEELEKSEEELKLEKRKLQRELRDAQSRLEELETTNNHLIKRFDKLKNARSNLLKDLSQDPA